MKCPNCQKEIDDGVSYCPCCNANLSFTTKDSSSETFDELINNIKEKVNIYKIAGITAILISMILFTLFAHFFGTFYVNGLLRITDIIMNSCIGIGSILLILSIILFIKKHRNNFTNFLLILSIIMLMVPILGKGIIKVKGNISLTDYSKAEYIELGIEKIPSLYSAVGYRRILLSGEEKDCYDSEMDINYDLVYMVYAGLSDDDINEYKKYLINYGFEDKNFIIDDSESVNVFVKNDLTNNEFYAVSIDGLSISYTKSNGRYEDIWKRGVEKDV